MVFVIYLQDNFTEKNKIFYVNLTTVKLEAGSRTSPLVTNSPRISPAKRLAEVVIVNINLTRGELNFETTQLNVSLNAILVNESVRSLPLRVIRTRSSDGEIGFHFVVQPVFSGRYTPASRDDYSPSNGTVTLRDGETSALFTINITDDATPEMLEEFFIRITKPVNGAKIGNKYRINVIIDANDNPYGRFG